MAGSKSYCPLSNDFFKSRERHSATQGRVEGLSVACPRLKQGQATGGCLAGHSAAYCRSLDLKTCCPRVCCPRRTALRQAQRPFPSAAPRCLDKLSPSTSSGTVAVAELVEAPAGSGTEKPATPGLKGGSGRHNHCRSGGFSSLLDLHRLVLRHEGLHDAPCEDVCDTADAEHDEVAALLALEAEEAEG